MKRRKNDFNLFSLANPILNNVPSNLGITMTCIGFCYVYAQFLNWMYTFNVLFSTIFNFGVSTILFYMLLSYNFKDTTELEVLCKSAIDITVYPLFLYLSVHKNPIIVLYSLLYHSLNDKTNPIVSYSELIFILLIQPFNISPEILSYGLLLVYMYGLSKSKIEPNALNIVIFATVHALANVFFTLHIPYQMYIMIGLFNLPMRFKKDGDDQHIVKAGILLLSFIFYYSEATIFYIALTFSALFYHITIFKDELMKLA